MENIECCMKRTRQTRFVIFVRPRTCAQSPMWRCVCMYVNAIACGHSFHFHLYLTWYLYMLICLFAFICSHLNLSELNKQVSIRKVLRNVLPLHSNPFGHAYVHVHGHKAHSENTAIGTNYEKLLRICDNKFISIQDVLFAWSRCK